jgi:hypothetical protein
MAKIDFPVATVDGQVFNSSSGVKYTYVGTPPDGYWSAEINNSGGGGGVTQDLQSVTDEGNTTTLGAEFAGTVKIEGDTNALFYRNYTGSQPNLFGGLAIAHNGVDKTALLADGSATFAGVIEVGTNFSTPQDLFNGNDTSKFGSYIGEEGALIAARANDSCLILNQKGDDPRAPLARFLGKGQDVIEFKNDGSALFAKTVRAGDAVETASSSFGILDPSGQIALQNNDPVGSKVVFSVFRGLYSYGDEEIRFMNDGFAEFKGTVTANGNVLTRNVVLNLEADDDDKYTSTTNEEGEQTRVYNGATLDVKESIRSIQAALFRLKAAVLIPDSSVDELRLRILEALENITQEVN